jgi:hypothetical protein
MVTSPEKDGPRRPINYDILTQADIRRLKQFSMILVTSEKLLAALLLHYTPLDKL